MFTRRFWKLAAERALKSAAQAVILGTGIGEGFDAFSMDWRLAAGFAVGGALLSLLTSMATVRIGDPGSPSAVG